MNRTTKYRGRCANTGEWVYGDLIHDCNGKTFISITGYSALGTGFNCKYSVDPDTVGQFTGLLDRNHEEIYEGDILQGRSYLYGYQLEKGEQFDYCGFVEWPEQCDVGLQWMLKDLEQKGSWALRQTVHRNRINFSTGEIIGNIHDNPELLKTK